MSKRTLDEFIKDFSETHRVLRPNPDWEEDLQQSVVVTPEIQERVRSYSRIKKKKVARECHCQDGETSPGVAPLIKMNDGHYIPSFGLGTWLGVDRTNGTLIQVKDDSVQRAVEIAIDAGYRHIDTASVYNTEEQVGTAIRNKIAENLVQREDLFVTSKLWNDRHKREDVLPALQETLTKLGLEYLDLYLIHFPISQYNNGTYYEADFLDTWKGMQDVRGRGLAKSIGVSNFNLTQMKRLLAMSHVKPAALQIEVNLNLQQPELIAYCKANDIAIVGYTPFGSLFHNKAKKDAPPPRTDEQALLRIADKYHKTIAQVALKYIMELGVIPIPKSVTKKRIEQNIDVFDFNLTQEERDVMKKYNNGYRVISVDMWRDSPDYPFEKPTAQE
ncbi:unnamed protein product [Chrysodeixis includens]|uniref:NADP-dependent oxidoreductase domain-containing protein n=1 Tax=Chrysodeixis includens TaxID=689277 RepID=A0A9P0BY84_CHRIL|nr:unnamed protein product [Chrysodeixis includens]